MSLPIFRWPDQHEAERPLVFAVWESGALAAAMFGVGGWIATDVLSSHAEPDDLSAIPLFLSLLFILPGAGFALTALCLWGERRIAVPLGMGVAALFEAAVCFAALSALSTGVLPLAVIFGVPAIIGGRLLLDLARSSSALRIIHEDHAMLMGRGFGALPATNG